VFTLRTRRRLFLLGVAGLACLATLGVSATHAGGGQVVVTSSQRVEIAVVLNPASTYTASIKNAIGMAVKITPKIHGFPVHLSMRNAPCGTDMATIAANTEVAAAIVKTDVVAVVGHFCSWGFGAVGPPLQGCRGPVATSALALYQQAGIVTINGSTTDQCLPPVGPTVFNRTALADPKFDAWYAWVWDLPSDRAWRSSYAAQFGAQPPMFGFADLYYDATRVLLAQLVKVSRVSQGNLVIDRAALAAAVRHTTGFPGVTCTVTFDPATGNRVDDRHIPPVPCARPQP
jgi:ABC-type branched-subunit amino acid transport system substrate-binding protein